MFTSYHRRGIFQILGLDSQIESERARLAAKVIPWKDKLLVFSFCEIYLALEVFSPIRRTHGHHRYSRFCSSMACTSLRFRKKAENDSTLAIEAYHTAKNEPRQVCYMTRLARTDLESFPPLSPPQLDQGVREFSLQRAGCRGAGIGNALLWVF